MYSSRRTLNRDHTVVRRVDPDRVWVGGRRYGFFSGSAAVLATILAGCGSLPAASEDAGSGQQSAPVETPAHTCVPMPSEDLVILADDLELQTVQNIVPAMSEAAAAITAIPAILNEATNALEADGIIALNRAVQIEGRPAHEIADQYVIRRGLNELGTATFPRPLIVGMSNFPDSQVLANIYAEALRAAGAEVLLTPVGNREVYLPKLVAGEIDVVPEYVGTLAEYLNRQARGDNARPVASSDLGTTTRELRKLSKIIGIAIGTPSVASNTNAFAVTEAFAEYHGIATLSELAQVCPEVTLGGPPDCLSMSFCRPGLEEKYGLTMAGFLPLDVGGPLTKDALRRGAIILGLVFALDGTLRST